MADVTPIPESALPAEVREASPKSRQLYATAVDFESLLVKQLTSSIAGSADDGDDEGGSSGLYGDMLPDALADSVRSGGGLGFALDLWRSSGGKDLA